MVVSGCGVKLFFLLLLPGISAEHEVDKLIQQVGEMDKYFSTDWHRFGKGFTTSSHRPDMVFGDWTLKSKDNFGQGYRGPVVSDDRQKLQGIFQSLTTSTLEAKAHHKDGRTCNITIEGPKLVRNYIRYYRRLKEKMNSDSGMMTLGFDYGGVNVTVGIIQSIDVAEQGRIKYLPYQIQDLRDVFGFTMSGWDIPALFTKYEITVEGDCLPNYDFLNMTNRALLSIPPGEQSQDQYRAWNGMRHSCPLYMTRNEEGNTPCFDLVKDLHEPIDQFFMVIIAWQTTLFNMYSEQSGYRLTHRVCTVNSIELGRIASYSISDRKYTVNKCCTLQEEHVPFYKFTERFEHKRKWHCYNPYHFSNILVTISKTLSFIFVAIFPLAIKWIPTIPTKMPKKTKREEPPCIAEQSVPGHDTVQQQTEVPTCGVKLMTEQVSDEAFVANDVCTEWMFLDDDSGYHFSFKVILSRLLLFTEVVRGIMVLRRLVLLYLIALLTCLASLQLHLYYLDLYETTWQFHYITFVFHVFNRQQSNFDMLSEYTFNVNMTLSCLVLPLLMAVSQFLLLLPVLLRKEQIPQILYWDEKDTAIGKYVGVKVQKRHQNVSHQPYEIKLYLNLTARLSYLTCYKFWKYVFTQSIFETHKSTCIKMIRIALRVLLIPVMVPCYTFPIFSVFWVIFSADGGFEFIRRRRCKVFFMRLVVGLGVVYFTSVLLACITMYVHMLMFIMVDVIRTLTHTLTHVIFIISAMVNIKETFNNIEDKYREIKVMVFDVLKQMSMSPSQEEQAVSHGTLREFDTSTVAIPRALFERVCKEHMPYGRLVTAALIFLLLKLTLLGLLYMIIVDYQVFAELSQTGEGFITIVFVSLPSLLSKNRSEAERVLEGMHMSLKVKSTIISASKSAKPSNTETDT